MNDEQLAEQLAKLTRRFGWWWRDPAEALRGKFLEKFQSFECDYQLQLAAFEYELASRAEQRKLRYLLGKRFDKLSYEEMCYVMDTWKRGQQPDAYASFIAYNYGETPLEMEELPLPEEQEWATSTGTTAPRYFKFNLRQFGDDTILEGVREWIKAQRKRLSLDPPKGGSASSKRKSFHAIECIDVWRNLSLAEHPKNTDKNKSVIYDGSQRRRAEAMAKQLREEWEAKTGKPRLC